MDFRSSPESSSFTWSGFEEAQSQATATAGLGRTEAVGPRIPGGGASLGCTGGLLHVGGWGARGARMASYSGQPRPSDPSTRQTHVRADGAQRSCVTLGCLSQQMPSHVVHLSAYLETRGGLSWPLQAPARNEKQRFCGEIRLTTVSQQCWL